MNDRVAHVVSVLAAALWLGGLLVIGAVVAPVVFQVVPSPTNADAMASVFARFDKLALGCAALVLVAEAIRVHAARDEFRGVKTVAWIRGSCAGVAVVLEGVIAFYFTPAIAELHASGARRGEGTGGLELDRVHRLAETDAKLLVAVLLVLLVVGAAGPRARSKGA